MKDNQQLSEEIIEEFVTKRKDLLSPDEVISIVLNAGISENQMHSILSDLRPAYWKYSSAYKQNFFQKQLLC